MKPNEIKAALVLKEITQASIAEELGVSRSAVLQVIVGNRPSNKIRSAIAKALGKSVAEVWPETNKEAA